MSRYCHPAERSCEPKLEWLSEDIGFLGYFAGSPLRRERMLFVQAQATKPIPSSFTLSRQWAAEVEMQLPHPSARHRAINRKARVSASAYFADCTLTCPDNHFVDQVAKRMTSRLAAFSESLPTPREGTPCTDRLSVRLRADQLSKRLPQPSKQCAPRDLGSWRQTARPQLCPILNAKAPPPRQLPSQGRLCLSPRSVFL